MNSYTKLWLIGITTLLTLALALIIPPHVFGQSQQNKAMTLYNSGNFSGAISLVSKQLITEPHNVKLLLDLGLSYEANGNHSLAAVYFNRVLMEAGSNPRYLTGEENEEETPLVSLAAVIVV